MIENPNPQQGESQNSRMLKYLQAGHTLTPLEALSMFDCLALAARMAGLRNMGHNIVMELVRVGSRKKVGRYRLVKEIEPPVIEHMDAIVSKETDAYIDKLIQAGEIAIDKVADDSFVYVGAKEKSTGPDVLTPVEILALNETPVNVLPVTGQLNFKL